MSAEDAATLAALLGSPEPEPSPEALEGHVDRWLESAGCPAPGPGSDPAAPEVMGYFLLRMAWRTYRRLVEPLPPVEPHLLARLEAHLARRPAPASVHGQLFIDASSSLRRAARVLTDGPILAVGDDDALTLALALLGARELAVVDIDPRVLEFLVDAAAQEGVAIESHRVDVLAEPVPPPLRRRFRSVVTDPFRDEDGGLGFVLFGAACLEREHGVLHWVDHPEWNFEHAAVVSQLEAVGLERLTIEEDLHAYPLAGAGLDPGPAARRLGLDVERVEALLARTSAFSHLDGLRWRRGR